MPPSKTSRSHQKRRKAREAKTLNEGRIATPKMLKKLVNPVHQISTTLESEDLPVAHGGYSSTRGTFVDAKAKLSLDSLRVLGIQVVAWNGM